MTGERYEPTGAELAVTRDEWEHRYRDRPVTQALRDALDVLSSGRVRHTDPDGKRGIDGAWYSAAAFRPLDSRSLEDPAVVVSTRALTVEVVVGFAGPVARDAWLADRVHGRPVPLASVMDGMPCRAAREELALSWLLSNGRSADHLPAWLRTQMFTTYSRSEIFLTWCDASPGATAADVADVLDRRLLHAPDWAADDIGEPGERTVPGYLHRIAATPATQEQATAAFQDLVRQDAMPAGRRPRPIAATQRPAAAAVPLLEPPRPGPDSPNAGPAQRF